MLYVMSGDKPVVEFDGNTYEYNILDKALAPLYITNQGNIRRWIEERAVDPTRANSRAVKSVQGLSKNASDYVTAMKMLSRCHVPKKRLFFLGTCQGQSGSEQESFPHTGADQYRTAGKRMAAGTRRLVAI